MLSPSPRKDYRPLRQRLVLVLLLTVVAAGAGYVIVGRVKAHREAKALDTAITSAEGLVKGGKPADALATIERWKGRTPEGDAGERLTALRLRALDAAGQAESAQAAAKAYLTNWPKGAAAAEAEFLLIRTEVEANAKSPAARERAAKWLAANASHAGAVRIELALARADIAESKLEAARERLARVHAAAPVAPWDRQVADLLGQVNMSLLFDGKAKPGEETVELKRGVYLYNIARQHKISQELLLKVNGITDPKRLPTGKTIRVPNVEWSLVCDKSKNTLVLYNRGEFFKEYIVRTGRTADSTPVGTYKILNKKTNPVWRSPLDGKTYGPDHPDNELGSRWMAFEGDILGIHGTIRPETIGHYASSGCIGMLKEDVEELYDLLTIGTPLKIQGTQDLVAHRVIEAPTPSRRDVAARGE